MALHQMIESSESVGQHVATAAEAVFDLVSNLRRTTESLFAEAHHEGRRVGVADLAAIDAIAIGMLGEVDGIIPGAGFISAPNTLSDAPRWLQWWQQGRNGSASRLVVELDPSRDRFYDYVPLPWFAVPAATGRRHVTGPYVDYVCSDEYALTFTEPIFVNGTFVGVAGADVFVNRYESLVLPPLRSLPSAAALVNTQGRVIVSNTARLVTGSLVRRLDLAGFVAGGEATSRQQGLTLQRCGDVPIVLLVGDRLVA
ncbi:cache domain-containing protein [Sporichthya brevicatena]|uniref:Cache domain-containing protein n=1 Tax=Sporichthya brevicatena TaxID=171442 RepID=A0ABN1H7T2_9ACTN